MQRARMLQWAVTQQSLPSSLKELCVLCAARPACTLRFSGKVIKEAWNHRGWKKTSEVPSPIPSLHVPCAPQCHFPMVLEPLQGW